MPGREGSPSNPPDAPPEDIAVFVNPNNAQADHACFEPVIFTVAG